MQRATVLVIEDHELFRTGLELLIAQRFPTTEIKLAAGVVEAIDRCELTPNVVLLDYNLSGISRDAAIALIRSHWPDAHLIVVTAEQDRATLERISRTEAIHLLPKSASLQEFAEVIGSCLPLHVASTRSDLSLSERQIEILHHMREGQSNKAIARILNLSEFTVRGHVQRILKLTGANNRTNAVFLAEQAGVLGNGRTGFPSHKSDRESNVAVRGQPHGEDFDRSDAL